MLINKCAKSTQEPRARAGRIGQLVSEDGDDQVVTNIASYENALTLRYPSGSLESKWRAPSRWWRLSDTGEEAAFVSPFMEG